MGFQRCTAEEEEMLLARATAEHRVLEPVLQLHHSQQGGQHHHHHHQIGQQQQQQQQQQHVSGECASPGEPSCGGRGGRSRARFHEAHLRIHATDAKVASGGETLWNAAARIAPSGTAAAVDCSRCALPGKAVAGSSVCFGQPLFRVPSCRGKGIAAARACVSPGPRWPCPLARCLGGLGSRPLRAADVPFSPGCHGEQHHAVAVPARAAAQPALQPHDHLDQRGRRVQARQRRGGGQAVGAAQEQAQHELRQAESGAALLLRQEHHQEGAGPEVRVPLRLVPGDRQDGEQDSVPREDGEHRAGAPGPESQGPRAEALAVGRGRGPRRRRVVHEQRRDPAQAPAPGRRIGHGLVPVAQVLPEVRGAAQAAAAARAVGPVRVRPVGAHDGAVQPVPDAAPALQDAAPVPAESRAEPPVPVPAARVRAALVSAAEPVRDAPVLAVRPAARLLAHKVHPRAAVKPRPCWSPPSRTRYWCVAQTPPLRGQCRRPVLYTGPPAPPPRPTETLPPVRQRVHRVLLWVMASV